MSNTCFSALVLSGSRAGRDRFVAEVADVEPWEFLGVHVPLDGRTGGDAWGTDGVKYDVRLTQHDGIATEFLLDTAWAPPHRWLERVATLLPAMTISLFCGCVEAGYGGYMRAEGGELTICERITSGFGSFFAERGRPGFFVPYWEDEDGQDDRDPRLRTDDAS